LSKSVLPKAPKTARKTSTQAAALKAQSDADKTLNMILSRLDDMKAEETVTIDLRGKSAFSDYMIVTLGPGQPARRRDRGKCYQGSEGNRDQRHPRRGLAQLRLGADRFRRRDRARIQTRGARVLQSGKIVDAGPDGGEGDLRYRPM